MHASGPMEGVTSEVPFARNGVWPVWIALFLLTFLLYAATANSGIQWQDSGYHIQSIAAGQLLHPLGLALSHPIHHYVGRLFCAVLPVSPPYAITLVSSFGAAIAVANVFGAVRTISPRLGPPLFAALSLALANTFWKLATITEVYTITAALFAAECWCVLLYARHRRWHYLLLAFLFNGLGLANHLSALLTVPVLVGLLVHGATAFRLRANRIGMCLLLWAVASLPYTGLVLHQAWTRGEWLATTQEALFGTGFAGQVLNPDVSAALLSISFAFVLFNFPNLLLPAAVYGVSRAKRTGVPRVARVALAAGFIVHALFVLRYSVVDRHTFFLPMYVLLAIFGGFGAEAVYLWSRRMYRIWAQVFAVVLLMITPLFYVAGTVAARHFEVLGSYARHKPYRDDYRYLLLPWSFNELSAQRITDEALVLAEPDGTIIYGDAMLRSALVYATQTGNRTDIRLLSASAFEELSQTEQQALVRRSDGSRRPIVLVPRRADDPGVEPAIGGWRPQGDLFVLEFAGSQDFSPAPSDRDQ